MKTKHILAVAISMAILSLSAAPAFVVGAGPASAIVSYKAHYDNSIGGHWECKGVRVNLPQNKDIFTCSISDISTLLPGQHTQAEFGWASDYDGKAASSFTLTVSAATPGAQTGPGMVQGIALY